ncbi:MAG: THUMP domain-containing class I SAM-dependent RNA methyltransferase [Bacteroidota bacterium]
MIRYHAKTLKGLEEVLADELRSIGADDVVAVNRGVDFSGNKAMMYKANFCLRTALRVLMPVATFRAFDDKRLYAAARKIRWSDYLDNSMTFAIDTVSFSEVFRNSNYITLRIKDAIVDSFRETTGSRPDISLDNPDIRINVHLSGDRFTVSLDSSGESLHKRGYRQFNHPAPLSEVLAAGIILLSGWKGEKTFLDPMCGSGTLAIEAAMIGANIQPGVFRKNFGFERWKDFDQELFRTVLNHLPPEKEFTGKIIARDIELKYVKMARDHVQSSHMDQMIRVEQKDFIGSISDGEPLHIVMNPPYGERIRPDDINELYKGIGTTLKHGYGGSDAWLISSGKDALKQIGLKPAQKIPLFNGPLESTLLHYSLFSGKRNEFLKNTSENPV